MKHNNLVLYLYNGPVSRFGRLVQEEYIGYTYASSEKQAYNNIKSRWKKDHGYLQNTVVELPGKLEVING